MKKEKTLKQKIISFAINIVVFALLIIGITWWQTRNLLPSGTKAPEFNLVSLSGKKISLREQKHKTTVLYFFSPFCTVCKLTSHNLVALREARNADKLTVLGIAVSFGKIINVKKYAKEHNFNFPVLLGNNAVSNEYKVNALPTIYVIDKNGNIKNKMVGYTTEIGLRIRAL